MFLLVMTTTNPATNPAPVTPKVRDILCSSWGYDQTNIDFYEVIAVTKASVRIVKINGTRLSSDGPTDTVTAVAGSYDPTDKGKIKRYHVYGDSYSVNISSYASASLWDGSPMRETAAGYGH